jgi:DNA-binding response OmpR family regulator
MRALIVDDERAFCDIAREFLSGFCEVRVAPTAWEGAVLFEDFQPDIMVVDNQLPDSPGADLVLRVRGRKEAYILLVSIDREEDIAARLLPQKADAFLKKPFRRQDLEEALLRAVAAVKRSKGRKA